MSLDFKHDTDNSILIIKITNLINLEELKKVAKKIFVTDDVPYNINTLYDLREMDFSNIDTEFEEKLVVFRESLNRGDAKIACVVASDLGFGMGRMYEALSDHLPQQVHIFRSMAEAREWLI